MNSASRKKQNRRSRRRYNRARKIERVADNPVRLRVIEEVKRLAGLMGFEMVTGSSGCGDLFSFYSGHRVFLLDYAPLSGKWTDANGCRGNEKSVVTVLEMVETIAGE